jgi:hypothetical protein
MMCRLRSLVQHFFVFETRHMLDVVAFVKRHWPAGQLDCAGAPRRKPFTIRATGGGAVKFQVRGRARSNQPSAMSGSAAASRFGGCVRLAASSSS